MLFYPIKGFEDKYTISKDGRVYSLRSKRLLKPYVDKDGYLKVCLSTCGKSQHVFVHRLVALVFLDKPSGKSEEVNHLDGNKKNNYASNLAYCTRTENIQHAWKTGLMGEKARKARSDNGKALRKLSSEQVKEIRLFYNKGLSLNKELSRLYGVSGSAIRLIIKGERYSEVV